MILSIDLGGTSTQYAVFDEGAPILVESVATAPDFIGQLRQIISATTAPLEGIALGVPGPTIGSVMQGSKPLNHREAIDFAQVLAPLAMPLVVHNDLTMAVHCELHGGAGLVCENFVLVSLSTGIGVAAVNAGRILQGRLELGHQVFLPQFSPAQACTNHSNCWVSLASGSAIERRFATTTHRSAEAIFDHVLSADDIRALQSMNAQGFAALINAYDPDVIVVMGSLGLRQFDRIVPTAALIEPFTINRPIPPIVRTEFGDQIGVIGGYHAARRSLSETGHGDR